MTEKISSAQIIFRGVEVKYDQSVFVPTHFKSNALGSSNNGIVCTDINGHLSNTGTIILLNGKNNKPIPAARCNHCLFTVTD